MNFDNIIKTIHTMKDNLVLDINSPNGNNYGTYITHSNNYIICMHKKNIEKLEIQSVCMRHFSEELYSPPSYWNYIISSSNHFNINVVKSPQPYYEINKVAFFNILDKSDFFNMHVNGDIPSTLEYDQYRLFAETFNSDIVSPTDNINLCCKITSGY